MGSSVAPPAPTVTSELKDASDFPVGIEAFIDIFDGPVPRQRVLAAFDRYTAANFYWSSIAPTSSAFDFRVADKAVAFATANGLTLHGHPLVYFQAGSIPAHLASFAGTKAEFEATVERHITTIVSRYRGRVQSWDVVNEMLGTVSGREFYNPVMERFYRSDAEYEQFIALCFRWAHAADPDAKLFYNEALLELPDARRLNAVIGMAQRLRTAGVPIHGIGTQMHVDIYWPMTDIGRTLAALAATGLLVHVSELDVSVNASYTTNASYNYTSLSTELAARQRDTYAAIARAYRASVPAGQRWGITMWDLLDHTSWLNQYRKEWPCLFDESANKKLAYFGMAAGLSTP
jgi:endo-1,4-beta-xylanase